MKKQVPSGSIDAAEALAYLATTVSEYEPMRRRSAIFQAFFALIGMTALGSVLIAIVLALAVGGCIALGVLGFISLMRFA